MSINTKFPYEIKQDQVVLNKNVDKILCPLVIKNEQRISKSGLRASLLQ
jgi:hypothetical protein